tara:strand:+ start:360 stop:512 length:153 start_codon:yes stop_codon:yes gene_type:complete
MVKLFELRAKPLKMGSISKVTGKPIKIEGGTQKERTLAQGFSRFGMYRKR